MRDTRGTEGAQTELTIATTDNEEGRTANETERQERDEDVAVEDHRRSDLEVQEVSRVRRAHCIFVSEWVATDELADDVESERSSCLRKSRQSDAERQRERDLENAPADEFDEPRSHVSPGPRSSDVQ